jgi:6-phospho-beta-glucosidase
MARFPNGFLWGSSTNAQQFEGGWNEGGKGVSIADVRKVSIMGTDTAPAHFDDFKVASDHYHHLEEDIAWYGKMGFTLYRFTISWSRIYPTGYEENPNEEGLAFYDRMLVELEKYHINPVVTLYAYDMPQKLSEEYSGWLDRRVVDAYIKYARTVITRYKGRIKFWIPFNEQNCIVLDQGYMTGYQAKDEKEKIQITHNFNIAWALCTKLVHEIDPAAKTGGNLMNICPYPETCNPADVEAADRMMISLGYSFGDLFCRKIYSPYFINYVAGGQCSLDNVLLPGDLEIIACAEPDFLSITYYMSNVISAAKKGKGMMMSIANPYTGQTEWGWNIDPYGFQRFIEDFWHRYQMPILITENGLGHTDTLGADGTVKDDYRIKYLSDHIERMGRAIANGAEIIGYLTWSAIDLYSTHEGFEKRYGFVYVDKVDLKRYPKKSLEWYKKVIAGNGEDLTP